MVQPLNSILKQSNPKKNGIDETDFMVRLKFVFIKSLFDNNGLIKNLSINTLADIVFKALEESGLFFKIIKYAEGTKAISVIRNSDSENLSFSGLINRETTFFTIKTYIKDQQNFCFATEEDLNLFLLLLKPYNTKYWKIERSRTKNREPNN